MQQPNNAQPTDLETQARQIASAPSKRDGNLAEERSMARRINTIIAASLPACKWQGKDPKKLEPCTELVFIAQSIFCEKHHKDAVFHHDTGKNIRAMYPDWDENLQITQLVPEKSATQPIERFKKTPAELVTKIGAANGARFKTAYLSNLRAALGVKKCQSCNTVKIEVLTDTSMLLCTLCFHLGAHVTSEFNGTNGEPCGVTGWAAGTKLRLLRSRQTANPEEERPPPADAGRRSTSRRHQSRSPEDNRGRSKAARTDRPRNPNGEPRQVPTESAASGASGMSEEIELGTTSGAVSPTSQAIDELRKLTVDSRVL